MNYTAPINASNNSNELIQGQNGWQPKKNENWNVWGDVFICFRIPFKFLFLLSVNIFWRIMPETFAKMCIFFCCCYFEIYIISGCHLCTFANFCLFVIIVFFGFFLVNLFFLSNAHFIVLVFTSTKFHAYFNCYSWKFNDVFVRMLFMGWGVVGNLNETLEGKSLPRRPTKSDNKRMDQRVGKGKFQTWIFQKTSSEGLRQSPILYRKLFWRSFPEVLRVFITETPRNDFYTQRTWKVSCKVRGPENCAVRKFEIYSLQMEYVKKSCIDRRLEKCLLLTEDQKKDKDQTSGLWTESLKKCIYWQRTVKSSLQREPEKSILWTENLESVFCWHKDRWT